jgi:apolipoprotein N-acyltransferase
MDFIRKAGVVQWILSGVLLGAGFVYSVLWPLGILGIAYFIFLVQQESSWKKIMCGGFISWLIKSFAALVWFVSVYPIEWLSVSLGNAQLIIILFYWITNSLWLGTAGIFAALILKKIFVSTTKKSYLVILVPTAWIVSEIMGSYIFSVMTYGDGGVITSAFSFGYVGYLLSEHEWLLQIARIYGVYSLSFVSVALALCCLWSVKYAQQKNVLLPVFIFIIFWSSAYVPLIKISDSSAEYYSVVTIDTAFPVAQNRTVADEEEKRRLLEEAMQAALDLEPDYIILPEDTQYFNQSTPSVQEKNTFKFLQSDPQVVIVDSGRADIDGKSVLQGFVYNGIEDTVELSHKRYLVPQGEFMPGVYAALLTTVGYGSVVESVKKDVSYTVGPKTSQATASVNTPGVLYCFESVSPWGVRKIVKERGVVPFIAHPVSHGWFNRPTFLWKNLDSMLRVQAVWNQQYIVSAGGHVAGQMFTPSGEIHEPQDIVSGRLWIVRQSFIPVFQ